MRPRIFGLADGANSDMIVKSAQKDPSIASGALLSYLHLRYLDIRQQKLVCLAQVLVFSDDNAVLVVLFLVCSL